MGVVAQVEHCLSRATAAAGHGHRSGREWPKTRWNGLCGRGRIQPRSTGQGVQATEYTEHTERITLKSESDLQDVYSTDEIARAAGVRPADVRDMARAGVLPSVDGQFFAAADAIAAVRSLAGTAPGERALFRPASYARPGKGFPLVASGGVHVAVLGAIVM